jgi:hypothetical protein
VVVSGPWSNVSVRPDFDPLEVLKSFNPADTLKGVVPGLGGAGQQQPQPQQPGGGVGDALKGLLGR